MSEWIKHTGTTNPVPDTVVEVYLKSGDWIVENSDDLAWLPCGVGSIVFYRVVDTNDTNNLNHAPLDESISKDTLKLVLTNALKNRKDISGLYADLIELL